MKISTISALSLGTLIAVLAFWFSNDNKQQLSNIEHQLTRLPNIERQLTRLSDIEEQLTKLSDIDRQLTILVEKGDVETLYNLLVEIEKQIKALEKTAANLSNNEQAAQIEETRKMLEQFVKNYTPEIVKDKNKEECEAVFAKAKTAKSPSDVIIYCTNALTKDPARFEVYQFIAQQAKKTDNLVMLDQMENIMEMGLYQVSAKDVQPLSQLLAETKERIQGINKKIAEDTNEREARATEDYKKQVPTWGDIISQKDEATALDLCKKRIAYLQLKTTDPENDKELIETTERAAFLEIVLHLDQEISTLNTLFSQHFPTREMTKEGIEKWRKDLQYWEYAMQNIESQVGQLWSLALNSKTNSLPENYLIRMQDVYKAFKNCNARFNKAYDTTIQYRMKDVADNYVECYGIPEFQAINIANKINDNDGDITIQIKKKTIELQKLSFLLSKVKDPGNLTGGWVDYIGRLAKDEIPKLQLTRTASYQKWAIEMCTEAREAYEKKKNEESAINAIKKYLAKIDVSQLIPETAEVYHELVAKYKAEIDDDEIKTLEEVERELANAEQKTSIESK